MIRPKRSLLLGVLFFFPSARCHQKNIEKTTCSEIAELSENEITELFEVSGIQRLALKHVTLVHVLIHPWFLRLNTMVWKSSGIVNGLLIAKTR